MSDPGASPYPASEEHAPLSGLDEFLVHNAPYPVRVMWTPDAQAYERVWFTCQDKVGELLVVVGLAFYPNLGTAEAFAIVNVRGAHTTVRAHRAMHTDRMDMIVGGRAVSPIAGYDGFGRQEGWVEVAGTRFNLASDTHLGTRDHHWGTRDGVGGPGRSMGRQHPHSGEWVEFEAFGIWGDHVLYNLGDGRKRSGTLARRVHRMRFEPDTHLLLSGEVDLEFADGSSKTMVFERLGNQIAFLRCGMYGGPNGGTPDGDLWHGMAVAQGDEVVVHGETFDVTDPAVRSRLAGLDQHHCRVTCDGETTFGIVEPYDTLCYEVSRAGVMGFSLLDDDA